MSGMTTSASNRSKGSWASAILSASGPSAATAVSYPARWRTRSTNVRTDSSSSTMSTRGAGFISCYHPPYPRRRSAAPRRIEPIGQSSQLVGHVARTVDARGPLPSIGQHPSTSAALVCFWRSGRRAGRIDVEALRRISQVATADDVVSLKDRARLMAGELHGHALRHAGPHEVANRGSAEVVRDATWAACLDAGLPPDFVEAALRDRLPRLLADRVDLQCRSSSSNSINPGTTRPMYAGPQTSISTIFQ